MSIFEMYRQGWQMGGQMAEDKKRTTLAGLMQQAHAAPREGRSGLVNQMIGLDPSAGMAMQKQFDLNDEASMKEVVNSARLLTQAPEPMRAQLYSTQILPKLKALGYPAPDAYGPEVDQYAQQIAKAWGPEEEVPAGVREFEAMTQGLPQQDRDRALRVQLGLEPRAAQPDQKIMESDDGRLFVVTPDGYREVGPAGGPQASVAGPSGGASMVLDDALTNAVMMQESGGDPNAVSPKGARGLMQIMPGTARDPGFGVTPMRDESPQENVRMGREYLSAMLQRYNGDQQLALAAYNAGPGRVDEALRAAGGNPQAALARLPAETRNYVPSVQARVGQGGMPTFGKKQAKVEAPKPSAVQQRQQMIAELEQADIRLTEDEKRAIMLTGKPPARAAGAGNGDAPKLSAGEAAKVRTQHKELKDALGVFKAFDEAISTIDPAKAQVDPQAKGRLGTAYNNARAYLRVLYNTGVLQPGEMPMLESALRDPTGFGAAIDPRSRGQIQAQLDELYRLVAQQFDNLVQSYPQLYDQQKYDSAKKSSGGKYRVGQVIEAGGKKYRVTGGDMNDPDVEEVR